MSSKSVFYTENNSPSPDSSGILCLLSLSRQRYSGWLETAPEKQNQNSAILLLRFKCSVIRLKFPEAKNGPRRQIHPQHRNKS